MYISDKIFEKYILTVLKDKEDRLAVGEILLINNLIDDEFYNRILAENDCDRLTYIVAEAYSFSEEVCEKLKYLCKLMFKADHVEIPNFFRYFDSRYDADQITEICKACIEGNYVADLFWPKVPAERMHMIRELTSEGVDASILANLNYDSEQAKELCDALKAHVDVSWATPQMNAVTIKVIKQAALDKLPIEDVRNTAYNGYQLIIIFDGMREGVNVLPHCDEGYTPEQIQELVLGLLQKVDISAYNDLKYDWEQMRQIRVGLKEGIDVSVYTTENLSAYYMEVLRLSMLNGDGMQFYGNTYDAETGRNCAQGHSFSIDDALESKRLHQMSVF